VSDSEIARLEKEITERQARLAEISSPITARRQKVTAMTTTTRR
jgi:hypothetical protein